MDNVPNGNEVNNVRPSLSPLVGNLASLTVPICLWRRFPSAEEISCAVFLKRGANEKIVCGTKSGYVCIANADFFFDALKENSGYFNAWDTITLGAEHGAVLSIVPGVHGTELVEVVRCLHEDGSLSVVCVEDGLCILKFSSALPPSVRYLGFPYMTSVFNLGIEDTIIVVGGHGPGLDFFHENKKMHIGTHYGHHDWIVGMTVVPRRGFGKGSQFSVLVSLDAGGVLCVWTLKKPFCAKLHLAHRFAIKDDHNAPPQLLENTTCIPSEAMNRLQVSAEGTYLGVLTDQNGWGCLNSSSLGIEDSGGDNSSGNVQTRIVSLEGEIKPVSKLRNWDGVKFLEEDDTKVVVWVGFDLVCVYKLCQENGKTVSILLCKHGGAKHVEPVPLWMKLSRKQYNNKPLFLEREKNIVAFQASSTCSTELNLFLWNYLEEGKVPESSQSNVGQDPGEDIVCSILMSTPASENSFCFLVEVKSKTPELILVARLPRDDTPAEMNTKKYGRVTSLCSLKGDSESCVFVAGTDQGSALLYSVSVTNSGSVTHCTNVLALPNILCSPILQFHVCKSVVGSGVTFCCTGTNGTVVGYHAGKGQSEQVKWKHRRLFCFVGHGHNIESVEWNTKMKHLYVHVKGSPSYLWNLNSFSLEGRLPRESLRNVSGKEHEDTEGSSKNRLLNIHGENYNCSTSPILAHVVMVNVENVTLALRKLFSAVGKDETKLLLGKKFGGALSFLLHWDMDRDLDRTCEEDLGISRPARRHRHGYGLLQHGNEAEQVLTLISSFKKKIFAKNNGDLICVTSRWSRSSNLTALHSLALITMFMSGIASKNIPNAQATFSRLVTNYGIVLPESLQKLPKGSYALSSFALLAYYSMHPMSQIHVASRLLLQGTIEQMDEVSRHTNCTRWAARMHHNFAGFYVDEWLCPLKQSGPLEQEIVVLRHVVVLVLSVFGVCHPGDLDPSTAKLVAHSLVEFLSSSSTDDASSAHVISKAFATELLSKGFALWRPHIPNMVRLVEILLHLTLVPSSRKRKSDSNETKSKGNGANSSVTAAQRALIEIGTAHPLLFIRAVGNEAVRPDAESAYHCCAILALISLIKKAPATIVRFLSAVVEVIIRTLDPSLPSLRKSCLRASTKALHELVKRFPMLSFHQNSQRFAVGTTDSVIVIYDLRTATKWRILEGHKGPLSAISFHSSGEKLASYCAKPPVVKIWMTGTGGFFGEFMAIRGRCLKTIPLIELPKTQRSSDLYSKSKITWVTKDSSAIQVEREDGSVCTLKT